MWTALGAHSSSMGLTVTISSSSHGGAPSAGTSSGFQIAPVGASGNLVYWSPTGPSGAMGVTGTTTLSGFSIGDESVTQVLQPSNVLATDWETDNQGLALRPVSCIGCHTSTPDGRLHLVQRLLPLGRSAGSGQTGTSARYVADVRRLRAETRAFIQPWVGITTYSINHWSDGDHIVVAPLGTSGEATPTRQPGCGLVQSREHLRAPRRVRTPTRS